MSVCLAFGATLTRSKVKASTFLSPKYVSLRQYCATRRAAPLGRGHQAQHVTTASAEPCYVTTPIYYVNDKPHIGHVYTSLVADVYARYQRQRGRDVRLLTGTDEHGLKVQQSAEKREVDPQLLADENSAFFRDALESFGISFDDFIRTTEARHTTQVAAFVQKLLDKGYVYLGEFEGWYDEGEEEYVTEANALEQDYVSRVSGRPLTKMKEENYYFKLSSFQEQIEKLYEKDEGFVFPESRSNEMINRIKAGLNDVPISRTNFTWGVEMPGHPEHVIYVWIDALFNYLTAIQMAEGDDADLHKYWPATVHVMAKEIVWFHGVIWPAVLMALELPLPQKIYAHSFWIRDGKKMSKSLGNFVDLPTLKSNCEVYGLDAIRYYLLTEGPIGSVDANWSDERLFDMYSADLVNTVGNCASRTTSMILKYYKEDGIPSELDSAGSRVVVQGYDWPTICAEAHSTCVTSVDNLDLHKAADAALSIVRKVDLFISETEPFKIAKDESKRAELGAILYQCVEAIRISGVLLEAILPEKMAQLSEALGATGVQGSLDERASWGQLTPGGAVQKVALFPRIDEKPSIA